MSFLYRLSYYLIGFIIGMFFLMFFFSGKKTSCNYSPSKRVKNDLIKKKIIIPNDLKEKFIFLNDSLIYSQKHCIQTLIKEKNYEFILGDLRNYNSFENLFRGITPCLTRALLVKNVQKAVVHIKVEKIMENREGQYLIIQWIYTTMSFLDVFSLI